MYKNRALKETKVLLSKKFENKLVLEIMELAEKEFLQLCSTHCNDCKAVKQHTEEDIYPCISLYRAMMKCGISQTDSLSFLDWCWSKRAEKKAKSMQMLCKIPGVYRKMPAIFAWVAKNQFGEKAGFKASFYDTEPTRCKFDMTKCLYCDVCAANGCPELVPCFCHTDDVTDGHIHPNLLWNRTKIMGNGADVCDFDLIVKKE